MISYEDNYYEILGNEINLGRAVITATAYIARDDFEKIEQDIAAKKEMVEFCFTPKDKSSVLDFVEWECKDRHTRLNIIETEITP